VLQNDVHMAHISVVPPTTLFTLVFHITCHRHDTYISLAKNRKGGFATLTTPFPVHTLTEIVDYTFA